MERINYKVCVTFYMKENKTIKRKLSFYTKNFKIAKKTIINYHALYLQQRFEIEKITFKMVV